jgi:translocation and assembly module TamB
MPMWRRLLVALVLAGLGVLGFAFVVVRSETGSRNLCALAEATLRDVARQRVVIGRCTVDPVGTRVEIEGVEVGPAERPVLAAERISAGIDPQGLLQGRVRIEGVQIVRPRIDADASRGGASEVGPQRVRGGSCLPDFAPLELGSVEVVGGDLELALPGDRRLSTRGLGISMRGEGRRLELALAASRTVYADGKIEGVVERTSLKGEVDLQTGAARLQALDLSAREGAVFAQADFQNVCTPRGAVNARIDLDLGRLGETLLAEVPHLAGKATLRARATIDGGVARLTADVNVEKSAAYSSSPGDFSFALDATPERVRVSGLELPLETGTVRAEAQVELAPPYHLALEAGLDRVSLGEVLRRVGVPQLVVHLVASGTGRLEGPLAGPEGLALAGTLDVNVPEFGVFNRTWQQRAAATRRWVGLERGVLRASFNLAPDALTLRQARLKVGSTQVDAAGRIGFDTHEGMALELKANEVELADLGPYGPAVLSGRGAATGTVAGPYDALLIDTDAQVNELRVNGFELGAVAAKARIDVGRDRLDLSQAQAVKGRSLVSLVDGGEITWDTDGPSQIQARLQLAAAHGSDLLAIAQGRYPFMRKAAENVDGLVDGWAELSGAAADPDVASRFAVSELRAWGQGFDSGDLAVDMEAFHVVKLKTARLRRGEGEVNATGTYTRGSEEFQFALKTRKLTAGDLDALMEPRPDLRGGVTLTMKGSGTLDEPRASGKLTLRDWRLADAARGDQPIGTARLRFRVAEGSAAIAGTVASPWPVGVKPPPRPPGADYPRPPGSMFHALDMTVSLADDLPFTANAIFDVPDAKALVRPGALGELEASVAGTLTAQGSLLRPRSASAALEVGRFTARKGRFRLANQGPAHLLLEEGRLTLQGLHVREPAGDFDLVAYGNRESGGAFDLTVLGDAKVDLLREFVPSLDEAKGRADLNVNVGGTLEQPYVVGLARVHDVVLRPRGVAVTLTGGAGEVNFSRDSVRLDVEGAVNGGPVTVKGEALRENGEWTISERDPLRMTLTELPLRVEDTPIVLSGSPTLHGTMDALHLGGSVDVVKFLFTRDLDLQRTIAKALDFSRRPPAPKVFEKSGEFLRMNMDVRLLDVRVENNLAQTDLRGTVRLTGTNRRPGLLGAVTLVDGRATVRDTSFVVTSGVVNFVDPARIRPTFDVRADAQVREYLVHVIASGTPQQPRVLLSSEPALPEADIVTLLTLGLTQRDLQRSAGETLGGFLLEQAYNGLVSDKLKRFLKPTELLKDASLKVTSAYSELSGNIEPVAQFETKLKLPLDAVPAVRLRAQTSLLGSRNRRAQAEFETQVDNLSGVLMWDGENPAAASTGDYGVDLKWSREWP